MRQGENRHITEINMTVTITVKGHMSQFLAVTDPRLGEIKSKTRIFDLIPGSPVIHCPLIPALRKKLGILKDLRKNIPRKSKLLLENGFIIGKLNFLLPIYGGYGLRAALEVLCFGQFYWKTKPIYGSTQNKYLDKLQVIFYYWGSQENKINYSDEIHKLAQHKGDG